MKKKVFCLLLLSCLLVGLGQLPISAATTGDFKDIGKHWAKDYINQVHSLGLVGGYSDGSFKPDNNMSRAEFTVVLINAIGATPSASSSTSFSDTGKHWAKSYIDTAVAKGILVPSEYPTGFKPDGSIVRSEVCAMMVRALAKPPASGSTSFKDQSVIDQSMYKGYIKEANELGLMGGYPDGTFAPFSPMKRGEICRVISGFLSLQGQTTPVQNPVQNPVQTTVQSGSMHLIAVGENVFDTTQQQISFMADLKEIPVATLAAQNSVLQVNGQYNFALNSTTNNPDIIIKSTRRYSVSQMQVVGDKLVVYPQYAKFHKITNDGKTYTSDFVKLFINSADSKLYLSNVDIVDANNVVISGKKYDLSDDKISIVLGEDYFDITEINIGQDAATPELTPTDSLLASGLSLSDISKIYVDGDNLDLDNIDTINFIIDGTRYKLKQITMDAAGNFYYGSTTYSMDEITMIIDDNFYSIYKVKNDDDKFVFYCDKSAEDEWVVVNDKYYPQKDISIIWDNEEYAMSKVIVVSQNKLRIDGKQHSLDSYKLKMNGHLYTIEDADFDNSLDIYEFEIDEGSSSNVAEEITDFVFYNDDEKYFSGDPAKVSIKAGSKWVGFDDVTITDPMYFSYDGTGYDLIGALVEINDTEFEITDTAWHGKTQKLDLYMKES